MALTFLAMLSLCAFVFALGFSMGKTWLQLKARQVENDKRSLELAITERRSAIITESKEVSRHLEDLLYRVSVAKQIEDITAKPHQP